MINRFLENISGKNFNLFITFVLFAAMSVLFTLPVSEGDFFWHVKSGQWIWQHKGLPASDPFTFINGLLEPTGHVAERTRFLLRQYWLGQLVFFGVWKAAGEAGMVILRSLLYTGLLGVIFWWLQRGRSGIVPLATVFVIGNVLRSYPGERPQIFAFIFLILMLYLLEQLVSNAGARKGHALLLFVVMLVWSNCHGSFILGVVVIGFYALSHLVLIRWRSVPPDRPLLVSLAAAMCAAGLNPNGFAAFLSLAGTDKYYRESITENLSPLTELFTQHIIDYYYWALLAAVIVTAAVRFRSMALRHTAVLLALAVLSLTGLRYIPFFILAAPLAAFYLPDWRPAGRYAVLPVLALLLWLSTADFSNSLRFRANRTFPADAVRFLNTARPSGNMFNYVYWGGYLMCNTDRPVFADGRGLDEKYTVIHNQVLAGMEWQETMSYFNINTMIIPGTNESTFETYPLLLQLYRAPEWSLIYQDDVALVFMKNVPQNREFLARYEIGKDRIARHISERLAWQVEYRL